MKKHIKALLKYSPPPPYTDELLSSIPEGDAYMVCLYNQRLRDGERPWFDGEGRTDGLCRVRINGYTMITNEDFIEIQDYVKGLEMKLKIGG